MLSVSDIIHGILCRIINGVPLELPATGLKSLFKMYKMLLKLPFHFP